MTPRQRTLTRIASAIVLIVETALPAQPPVPAAQRWLEGAPPVPELHVPATREAWEARRLEIRAQIEALLGHLPQRPPQPSVHIRAREDRGDYLLERFEFDNGAGAVVPGCLLLPKTRPGRVPAILYCHWHGGEYDKGKIELFEAAHTPEAPGPALARRGYAVLAIDACCFGERQGQGPGGPQERGGAAELTASKYQLWLGRSLWGMMLRDDLMALDYLATRPEVDVARIGATGMSMGATRTWWLMALDDRIRVGVAVACLTRYQDLIAHEGLKHHGIYYFVPGLLRHFDTEAVVALSAPRPLLLMNGDRDDGSPVSGIRTVEQRVRSVYRLYGADAHFRSDVIADMGHEYRPAMWAQTLAWFAAHLKPGT